MCLNDQSFVLLKTGMRKLDSNKKGGKTQETQGESAKLNEHDRRPRHAHVEVRLVQ
jgi:hypothetical protein